MEYTIVLGVDENHINKLRLVLPTWVRHKPSMLKNPMVVFYDYDSVLSKIHPIFQQYGLDPEYQIWPPDEHVVYEGTVGNRWSDPQRYKMLAGFVYVPAMRVETPYWLKLDLDVVATGKDKWVDERWFEDNPSIISHPWGYTKPANQMEFLDRWVKDNEKFMPGAVRDSEPLNLIPQIGATCISHQRIISWCSFYSTEFSRRCSSLACKINGAYKLPVPSQDGYMFYIAKRLGLEIVRPNMKRLGWQHCSSINSIKDAIDKYQWSCDA